MLSDVNQAVMHSHSREELLDAVCPILVERGKVDLAWVGWLEPATSHIKSVAQHGRHNDILGRMNYFADNRPEGQANPGKAIREGKAVICKTCPGVACLYPSEKQPYLFGFQSCGSFPLRFQGQVCAVLNICVSKPEYFGGRETELLQEVTLNLSFALDKLAAEAQREQAEKAVKDSETRFRRLFESMRDAYAEVDLDGKIINANKTFAELIGYDDAELSQLSYRDITPEQWHDPEKKILQEQILIRGYSEIYEKEYRRQDGSVIPVELRTFLLRDESGQPTSFWAIIRDITQRKQAQEALRQSEEKFRLAMEAANEGLWDWDIATGELYWSPGFFRVAGYDPDEIKPNYQLWEEHVHPEDLPRVLKTIEKHLLGLTPLYECEYRVRTKVGQYLWILARGRVVRYDPDGAPRQMMGAVSDITEKKQAQDFLEESLSLLKATLESTADGILAIKLDGRIMGWNSKFLEMWHIPEDIIANRDSDRVKIYIMDQLQDPQSFLRLVDRLYTRSERETCDLLHFKDGRVFERHTKPQYLDGQIIGRVLSFRDVTAKLQSEITLKESEARYRRIVDTMGEGIWVVDKNYQTTYVNQVMAEMLGYRLEEMLGQSLLVFLFPEDLKQHKEMRVRRRQGLGDKYARRFKRKDGSELWTSVSATAIMDETGSFQGSFGMFIDNTEKKRAEAALRQSEQRYRSMVENLPVGVYRRTVGDDNRLLMVNPALLKIFGYDAADNFMELGSSHTYADLNQFKQFNEQLALNGQVSGVEVDLLKKDGNPF
jgi:PAS domain S-box-containing protein